MMKRQAPAGIGANRYETAITTDIAETARPIGPRLGGHEQSGGSDDGTSIIYSASAISDLLYMIEEEKLAGDVYEAFFDLYGLKIFDNIAESEDRHFDALINLAENIGLDVDTFVFEDSGTFENEELQALYDTLVETGSVSLDSALEIGVMIEEKDLTDIAAAAEEVEGTTLAAIYDNLIDGSINHLAAFESALLL